MSRSWWKLSRLVLTTAYYSRSHSRESGLLHSSIYLSVSVPLTFRTYQQGSTERVSVKINIVDFYENMSRNSKFGSNEAIYMKA